MVTPLDDSMAAFVQAIRNMVAPVEHLSDAELEAADMPQPVIKLLLSLRANLRDFDAAEEGWRS